MLPMSSLPGNDLIMTGIEDLQGNRETIPALLVAIGAPNCAALGWRCLKTNTPIQNIASTICWLVPSLILPTPDISR